MDEKRSPLPDAVRSLDDALDRLGQAVAITSPDGIAIDAMTKRFEITFDLFWKALRRRLAHEGIEALSARG